ncbi:MAG: hypothetical protein ACK5S6_02065 [bacterium]
MQQSQQRLLARLDASNFGAAAWSCTAAVASFNAATWVASIFNAATWVASVASVFDSTTWVASVFNAATWVTRWSGVTAACIAAGTLQAKQAIQKTATEARSTKTCTEH